MAVEPWMRSDGVSVFQDRRSGSRISGANTLLNENAPPVLLSGAFACLSGALRR
jgi:hypothetical protein